MIMKLLLARFIILAALIFMPVITVASPALAIDCAAPANAQEAIQCGASGAAGQNIKNQELQDISETSGQDLGSTVKKILNILSTAIAIIAVIMIVVGGFRYVTSAGKQESVTAAKNTIIYAVVGLIIVAFTQAIVHFVLREATTASGSTSTTSNTP